MFVSSEHEALVALFKATGGENWNDNTNWLKDEPICSWLGVICENNHVVSIDLNGNNLQGPLPPEIGMLTHLMGLGLLDNQITSVPPEIGQLTSLQYLSLSDNQISSLPAEMGQLSGLLILMLENNRISSVPSTLGQLTSLQELYLSGNPLSSLPPELCRLTELYIDPAGLCGD
ncbi:MAG: leucine-rich repeat domain-containing protein [Anaerolineae bacterium]|nr:leucine-rich repeat domain-containing protein [Anaerolineae bacterium]